MIPRLVWRSLVRRPGRSALLLAGYALGVAVTVALLSIGSALLEQARDRELAGGGDLAVLPAGIDLETLKTGGVSSLYFTVEQAPFLYRQVLAGPRFDDRIEAAAPWIDDELVYLEVDGRRHAASAGGRIPGLSRALGVRPEVVAGVWEDGAADRRWRAPGDSALYAEMDRFHLPDDAAAGDSTWAEWHYFNVRLPVGPEARGGDAAGDGDGAAGGSDTAPGGWLYLTYMVTGAVPDGRWGGRLLATLVTPGTGVLTREARVAAREVAFSEVRPDLRIGPASVALDSTGTYRLALRIPGAAPGTATADGNADGAGRDGGGPALSAEAESPPLRVDLAVRAASRQHLPPLEISPGGFRSGYTAPILDGRAEGRVCVGDRCRRIAGAPAYHDHNWGVWRAVTWDWGQARAGPYSVLYGGVRRDTASGPQGDGPPDDARPGREARGRGAGGGRRFLFLSDTLGFLGLFRLDSLDHRWTRAGPAVDPDSARPRALGLRAARPPDTARMEAEIRHVRTSRGEGAPALFYQMEGPARLDARLRGREVDARGRGFFETWRRLEPEAEP